MNIFADILVVAGFIGFAAACAGYVALADRIVGGR